MTGAGATVGIVGGGPAGSALAIRLRRLGYSVLMVADGRCRYAVQGLSERAIMALRQLDAPRALKTLGAPASRLVVWNGREARPNAECLVDRRAFDRAMLTEARHAGADVVRGFAPRRSLPACGPLEVVGRDGVRALRADAWIEARGRSAPRSGKPVVSGPSTLTLQQPIEAAPGDPWSAVAALPDGWCWVGMSQGGRGLIQRTLDRSAGPPRGGLPKDLLHPWPLEHPLLDSRLRDARPVERVRGFATETVLDVGDPLPLRVGDALTAPDPLSGHGVCEAIANARYAAAAVNTMMRRPGSGAFVHRFIAERARERYVILGALGRHSYGQEQRWTDHDFWVVRRAPAVNPASPEPAFPEVRRGPVLEHDEIVLRDMLILPQHPRGVWRVHDVPVVELMLQMRAGNAAAKAAAMLQVSPLQAAQAMQWLREQKIPIDLHA